MRESTEQLHRERILQVLVFTQRNLDDALFLGEFARVPRDQWNWRLMIRTPEIVTRAELHQAATTLIGKGKAPSADQVKLESVAEGLCVQMLHIGPYDREIETIARMKAFAAEKGLGFHGRHHEIYLSDPRRVAPERLKTILRIPVRKAGR